MNNHPLIKPHHSEFRLPCTKPIRTHKSLSIKDLSTKTPCIESTKSLHKLSLRKKSQAVNKPL